MSTHVVVNPIDCAAHGMCAELLPERISLDDWGYPIIDGTALSAEQLEHARRAAEACPTFALLLEVREREPLAFRRRARDGVRPAG
ncbi:MAG: ferredoxin [Solirubrobacteraceae bacterium]